MLTSCLGKGVQQRNAEGFEIGHVARHHRQTVHVCGGCNHGEHLQRVGGACLTEPSVDDIGVRQIHGLLLRRFNSAALCLAARRNDQFGMARVGQQELLLGRPRG